MKSRNIIHTLFQFREVHRIIVNFSVFLSMSACRHLGAKQPCHVTNPNNDIPVSSVEGTADDPFQKQLLLHVKSNRFT